MLRKAQRRGCSRHVFMGDFIKPKKKSMSRWPLLEFHVFLNTLRKSSRTCDSCYNFGRHLKKKTLSPSWLVHTSGNTTDRLGPAWSGWKCSPSRILFRQWWWTCQAFGWRHRWCWELCWPRTPWQLCRQPAACQGGPGLTMILSWGDQSWPGSLSAAWHGWP